MSKVSRRQLALLASCPQCGARRGMACQGVRGNRKAPHQARLKNLLARATKEAGHLGDEVPPARMKRQGFYWSDEWRAVRYQALKLHGGACQCCGARGTKRAPLHVDHIKPRSRYPHLALEISNLQVLCEDCNLGKGASDDTDWRPAPARLQ
ncbi:HNH endonuclease [Methylobacterium nodulans]|uniref:HNH endonuclease n=1 Tax=Methylobacterium nodulans (strain LMG 21967 / CNCM I-2342 / ORS 2060) TaxID=460265 RepID=B8IXG5_METNO|nr:HNH endonuclease signature motif containing protein [Methylobacterium nodulans]ACL63206.1 HNH endonuclease [Methylobacterium nodulans ORS 2060]